LDVYHRNYNYQRFDNAFYILVYTQMICGEFGTKFTQDDYILAAVCLFSEIMNLFMMLLQILSALNN